MMGFASRKSVTRSTLPVLQSSQAKKSKNFFLHRKLKPYMFAKLIS